MNKDEKIKELENKLTIIQEEISKLKTNKFPTPGDKYWYLNLRNVPCIDKYFQIEIDMALKNIGNFFETEEEAQKELDKRILLQELKEFADYEPEWEDASSKFYIVYDWINKAYLVIVSHYQQRIGNDYFSSEEKAQKAIEHFGDRLKVLF